MKFGHGLGFSGRGRRKQRKGLIAQALDRPQRLAPGELKRGLQSVGLGDLHERSGRDTRAPPEIIDRHERLIGSRGDDGGGISVSEAAHHAQTEPDREVVLPFGRLHRAVPARGIDANRANLDAVIAGIAHYLRGRVEAHRLRVQESRTEDIRMMAFEP